MKLTPDFYQHDDVLKIARALLGKYLFTCIDGSITGGFITECEAYCGVIDKASHAFGGRLTNRTRVMYENGGISYIYLCYGIHEMFNIVTGVEGTPHAILIRGIDPEIGLEKMLERRGKSALKPNLTTGPGSVAMALGISRKINGISLYSDAIWIEDKGMVVGREQIACVPRIGVQYAGDDALLPYRFYIKNSRYVSKPDK
ncbi:MAG: DNA-3-methyladenine glycosylase [Sphingobacteriaceae bacterium]